MERNRKKSEVAQRKSACTQLVTDIGENGIKKFGSGYRIALHTYLYQHRDQN
jgi:hypothetical protein